MSLPTNPQPTPSDAARQRLQSTRGEPLFLADWVSAAFFHFEVPAEALQREVPFELDLHEGRAYVSLVAFTMERMRPRLGGRLAAWLLKPIASNRFLNVRTYVRHRCEAGIYFIREWLDNRLSVLLGPRTFGLPYRLGELDYDHAHSLAGAVRESGRGPCFKYRAPPPRSEFRPCAAGSLDAFLVERYVAFTSCRGRRRFFRVWHPPWPVARIEPEISESALLERSWPLFTWARYIAGHFSPGVWDVWMGRPQRVVCRRDNERSRRHGAFFELQ